LYAETCSGTDPVICGKWMYMLCMLSTINFFKNQNRMQVVGIGGGVKKGRKSEMWSGDGPICHQVVWGEGIYL
jgi:hypothetical protein